MALVIWSELRLNGASYAHSYVCYQTLIGNPTPRIHWHFFNSLAWPLTCLTNHCPSVHAMTLLVGVIWSINCLKNYHNVWSGTLNLTPNLGSGLTLGFWRILAILHYCGAYQDHHLSFNFIGSKHDRVTSIIKPSEQDSKDTDMPLMAVLEMYKYK